MTKRTILLTGFEAFGTTPVNPAEQVALKLDGEEVSGAKIVSRIIPNTFFVCIEAVKAAIEAVQPEAVVMMGECGGRAMITVERIAQNLNDCARYGVLDNEGNSLQGVPTVENGPAAYYTTLPIRAMVKAMREKGIPADISDAAGTFCCNHLMYGILHYAAQASPNLKVGWVHLPHLPEVAVLDANLGAPSMSVETSTEGLRQCIYAICSHPTDISDNMLSRLQI